MPDGLYETDLLAWSRAQADRLRRVAAGERVNDVDWAHVIEEIEGVGRSELKGVRSFLELALTHALKIAAAPDDTAVHHWTVEVRNFLAEARHRFEPGMAQHIDLDRLYGRARREAGGAGPERLPIALDALLDEDFTADRFIALFRQPDA